MRWCSLGSYSFFLGRKRVSSRGRPNRHLFIDEPMMVKFTGAYMCHSTHWPQMLFEDVFNSSSRAVVEDVLEELITLTLTRPLRRPFKTGFETGFRTLFKIVLKANFEHVIPLIVTTSLRRPFKDVKHLLEACFKTLFENVTKISFEDIFEDQIFFH